MKPVFAKILEGAENSVFQTKLVDSAYFSTTFHFHAECQINYVIKSTGKRIIGDNVDAFEDDELIFIGANLPHVWHNDQRYFEEEKNLPNARSVSLFFDSEKLIRALTSMVKTQRLEALLQNAKRGMLFFGETKTRLKALLLKMANEEEDFIKLSLFFKILNILSHTKEYSLLASMGYVNNYQLRDNDRMDKVFKYVFTNFSAEIQLAEVAALVNMNKQAFCRYFKNRTQKTLVEFVNEVRIGHACKLIASGEHQINNLAYECGFNSLSNFNRFFKDAKGLTPREYKKTLLANGR